VLEKVIGLRCPFDQLPLLELIESVSDLAGVLWMSNQPKKQVMKQIIGQERSDGDYRYPLKYQNNIQVITGSRKCSKN
jgi:hypothetical protein